MDDVPNPVSCPQLVSLTGPGLQTFGFGRNLNLGMGYRGSICLEQLVLVFSEVQMDDLLLVVLGQLASLDVHDGTLWKFKYRYGINQRTHNQDGPRSRAPLINPDTLPDIITLEPAMDEDAINLALRKIHSGIAVDSNSLSDCLGRLLEIEEPYLIAFMNNKFFRSEFNLVGYIKQSIQEGLKQNEEARKIIYEFIADYISTFKSHLKEYLKSLFDNFFGFFKLEKSHRPKERSLEPLRQIILSYESEDLLETVLVPLEFHKSLVNMLKIEKITPSVRGELWHLLGIVQNKFASEIPFHSKREVQVICLSELKKYVNEDKNVSAIACILRSFSYSLHQKFLDDGAVEELFRFTKAIMIPLKSTFDASIAALELLDSQSALFHPYIVKGACVIFKQLSGLMGHHNKNFKFAVLDTLCTVVREIVGGIRADVDNPQMVDLFHFIGNVVWSMLERQTVYDPSNSEEKNRYAGSVITVVKILGILSPLILTINGKDSLRKFFSKLLGICGRKVIRAFEETEGSFHNKTHMMKVVLYNQKQLISFISSFARIVEQLEDVEYTDALRLEELFMVAVRQYPFYLEKYKGDLIEAMVAYIMGISTKSNLFSPWIKKLVLMALMESLDAKRHNINSDRDYYKMIEKAASLWKSLLGHPRWANIVLLEFSKVLFDSMEHLFVHLDVSYKTSIEMEIEEEEQAGGKDQNEDMELVNVFFMSDENIQMCNIADYQYMSGLVLVFHELMLTVDASLYSSRVFAFYGQVIYRLKILPKSIPLMKIVRCLNCFIVRNQWFEEEGAESRDRKELLDLVFNFYKFTCSNVFKFQENYFYESLKMLLSMPFQVYLANDCSLLKNHLPLIINKSLQLGQEIISLAYETILCIDELFWRAKSQATRCLSSCIPELEKYLSLSKQVETGESQEKEEVRSYLFLRELKIRRGTISKNVLRFLGTVGGLSHQLVQHHTKDYISWDYHCKLELTLTMDGEFYSVNLIKLLDRTCWLMHAGRETQKIVASEFMHAVVVYVIGRTASKALNQLPESKENLSNFFDRVLPTILQVSSNTSHPSQQLIHSLLVQTIHFLANTQDPNSPDIQTLLKHLIALYTGAEDASFLASKCLSELIKWHIKQAPAIEGYPYPIIKTVVRNVWSLVSHKKARNGLIQLLIKFLKVIHREQKLMSTYSIQLCCLIISLSRSDRTVEPALDYLVRKFVLAISPVVKFLIFEQGSRKFRKISTLQKLLEWIYHNALFSVHRQQRIVSFSLWESMIGKYGAQFDSEMQAHQHRKNIQVFLSQHCDRERKYLFSSQKSLQISEEDPKLEKVLPKICAYGEMWTRIQQKSIFEKSLVTFRDYQQIYLQSICSFLGYFVDVFMNMPPPQRISSQSLQKQMVTCLLVFAENTLSFRSHLDLILNTTKSTLPLFQQKPGKTLSLAQLYLKLIFRPSSLIPNFNYDLIHECSECLSSESEGPQTFERTIIRFLRLILQNTFVPSVLSYFKSEFKQDFSSLIGFLFWESELYDREIKCILQGLATMADELPDNLHVFDPLIKSTLEVTVKEHEHKPQTMEIDSRGLSTQRKNLLVWFILQFAGKFELIHNFLVRLIEHDTVIYHRYEKLVLKSIAHNWQSVGPRIIGLVKVDSSFLKVIFILCKTLDSQQLPYLYELVQENLLGIGVGDTGLQLNGPSKSRALILSDCLKVNFFMLEHFPTLDLIRPKYVMYICDVIMESLNVTFSLQVHEEAMNLAALMILRSWEGESKEQLTTFIPKFRSALKDLFNLYIPTRISQMGSSEARSRCLSFLKVFRSTIILSKDLKLIELLFSTLRDQGITGFYATFLSQTVEQCLLECYQKQGRVQQAGYLEWMMGIFWDQNIDRDCWMNFRVVLVQEILRKALRMTHQDLLISFFEEQAQRIIDSILKVPVCAGEAKQIILALEIKRASFQILEELYSNLPRKEKATEAIHSKELHKAIIKHCLEPLKHSFNQQLHAILSQYDIARKEQLVVTKTEKEENRPSCLDYVRRYCCSAYNCLIVIFISTQSNKAHFTSYLFESRNHLWSNILDASKTAFDFEIETSFEVMKPVKAINKTLRKTIRDKYWSTSLYAIEEEYVPTSLVDSLPVPQSEPAPQQEQDQSNPALELDTINQHPCMLNVLRVIDFLDSRFNDGTQPAWMKPIYEELSSDTCPLAVRIFLTKLIMNRPKVFTHNIWAEALLKYLTLAENGAKFIHYFFRDGLKQLIEFMKNGYVPEEPRTVSALIMKVVRALPHENRMIYGDNVDLLESFLQIPGVFVQRGVMMKMLMSQDKNEARLKFEWRMCALIVLKSCMVFNVPVLNEESELKGNAKLSFYSELRKLKILHFVSQMMGEPVKKYRITASGFLGELLNWLHVHWPDQLEYQELVTQSVAMLKRMNELESNRNAKEKFSLCVYHMAVRHPQILQNVSLYSEVESCLTQYAKEEREQILHTLIVYVEYLNRNSLLSNIPFLLITIRKFISRILGDTLQVQTALVDLLLHCCKHELLARQEVIETYFYIFDQMENVYSKSTNQVCALTYYRILVSLKNFIEDPDLDKSQQISQLGALVHKALIKGLGSPFEDVRTMVFSEFENSNQQFDSPAQRLISIFKTIYDKEYEELWLVNVVPLSLSLVKKSSDYTRLRFEEALGELTAYYDWDFRKNMKLYNSSQPYTPAFTLATGANQYRRVEGGQPSLISSVGGDKLRGMLRASQNAYMSQEEQVFTILASQSDYNSSYQSSLGQAQMLGSQEQEQETTNTNESMKKIREIFGHSRRKRNRIIEDFNDKQLNNMGGPVKLVNRNIRFNKNFDKSTHAEGPKNQSTKEQKGVLIRKYKVGELPDIQITTKDLVDPMLFLASHDHEFANELFLQIFTRVCMGSQRHSKDRLKDTVCELLDGSQKHDYNFVSSLQKSLIYLCRMANQKIDYSMKEIAYKSSTFDYAIIFAEETQIQNLRNPELTDREHWLRRVRRVWGDLIDLYHHIDEDDLINGALLKLAEGEERKTLLEAHELKKTGKISECQKTLNRITESSENERIQEFIDREKVECQTLLGEWDSVLTGMGDQLQRKNMSVEQQKIFSIALQNTKSSNKEQIFQELVLHPQKCEYQKAVLSLLCTKDIDQAKYHSENALRIFLSEWKKVSSFAFSSKHTLLEEIQKVHELQEFLDLYEKQEVGGDECRSLFRKWSTRPPDSVHDSNMTWIQLLESRIMFGGMLKHKFNISEQELAKSTLDWLIQVSTGMVHKGVLGGAEPLIRRALACKKSSPKFVWEFYESIVTLKLNQYMMQNSRPVLSDYQVVPRLIQKQMKKDEDVREIERLKFVSIQNECLEGYLLKCVQVLDRQSEQDFVQNVELIYKNYESMKRSLKSTQIPESPPEEVLEFKRDMYFKFTMFLDRLLSLVRGKFEIPEIKESMVRRNYSPERLSHVFVETLFAGIEISDFSQSMMVPRNSHKTVFALILKLLKVIQMFPRQVGDYFTEAISNHKIPVWIFLYFIPQIIKFLNHPELVTSFEDLFRMIAAKYPEALVYNFNCYYEKSKECQTDFCRELRANLHTTMEVNFRFIDSLVLLQFPEIRLKEALYQLSMVGEKDNAIDSLRKLIQTDESLMGKYNNKFVNDYRSKVQRILNKIEACDSSVKTDIETVISEVDCNNKDNKRVIMGMRNFVKVSDASTFFEEYNSNDWSRIEVPGTSYRSFEEPRQWEKVYIDSFDHSLKTLMSKQRPRRITVFGSDEKKYMLLVKSGEDVRLDQRIEELFDIMNKILRDSSECSRKQLQIHRFEVVPIRKMMGVFEWVDESQTLKQFLETELKAIKETDKVNLHTANGAYETRVKFMNRVVPIPSNCHDSNYQHKALLKLKTNEIVKCFIDCEAHIPYGLLRRALGRLSKNYDSFLHIKNTFLSNYAVVCVVTYLLGIGDRHLENFLIHMSSASIVPIDFGFSFGAVIDLGVPELIPFRLTKCFEELADPIGLEGLFKQSMICSLQAFAQNIPLLADYCQIFVDDPLLEWIWSNRRAQKSSSAANNSFSSEQEPKQKAYFNRKIESVRRKLEGYHPRIILEKMLGESSHKDCSYFEELTRVIWQRKKNKQQKLGIPQVVDQLISLATDKNILGRTYIGWNPYI